MKLTEMLGQYEELLDKKDQLAKDTKDNNAKIEALKQDIAQQMIDDDCPRIAVTKPKKKRRRMTCWSTLRTHINSKKKKSQKLILVAWTI